MAEVPLSPVALRRRRERTIELLCEHFARDHLETAELEELIDRAHRASSLAELDGLLADLPDLPSPAKEVSPAREGPERAPVSIRQSTQPKVVAAIMGGAERKGHWIPARETSVVAVMGGVCLDFRHAHLDPGVTEVSILALMGGVEIIVPPDLHVESSGIGIMGGFEHSGQGRFPVDSSVPVLRINGLAFMGGVEIHERPEGESGRARIHRNAPRGRLDEGSRPERGS